MGLLDSVSGSVMGGQATQPGPHGAAPQGGPGNAGDLMGMLGGLLHK